MGLLDEVRAARRGERAWPVGAGEVLPAERIYGHDQSQHAPPEYGDYIATSNDVYTVVTARARLVSQLRLKFYRGSDSRKRDASNSPAARLYGRVNPFWTAERLARMDEVAMGLWGQSAWAIEPGSNGEPSEIWWLKPSRLRPVPHATGYIEKFIYESVVGELIEFEAEEVVWFRYPNPLDEFAPLAPLAAVRLAADTSSAMLRANNALLTQGLLSGGLVVPDTGNVAFSSEQAEDLERALARRFKGVDKAHKWGVLRFEAKFHNMSVSQKDAEFVEGLNLTFRQVCRAYGMQSALLNDLEHATLANASAFERLEWTRTLAPDVNLRAAEVREQYLPRFRGGVDWCEYDFTSVPALQESATEQWVREAQALDRGALTINEWRTSKGMPPVAWGDRPYMPVNKAPLNDDGTLDLPVNPLPANASKLPDDEVNPSTPAKGFVDHLSARRLLAALPVNGVKL
jgi:HK97 family phage portal protein